MPKFGTKSKAKLKRVHPDLRKVINKVIPWFNFTILEGHRSKELQNKAFAKGRSKVKWPDGKHNTLPSEAVDIAPWPVEWPNKKMSFARKLKVYARFYLLAGAMLQAGKELGIELRWGGDWDSDLDLTDQIFDDLPHFELLSLRRRK